MTKYQHLLLCKEKLSQLENSSRKCQKIRYHVSAKMIKKFNSWHFCINCQEPILNLYAYWYRNIILMQITFGTSVMHLPVSMIYWIIYFDKHTLNNNNQIIMIIHPVVKHWRIIDDFVKPVHPKVNLFRVDLCTIAGMYLKNLISLKNCNYVTWQCQSLNFRQLG